MNAPANDVRWPAEWEPQDGVLMAWPHERTLWSPYLADAQRTSALLVAAISRFEPVLLVTPPGEPPLPALRKAGAQLDRVTCFAVPGNDIWTRDYGPITILEDGRPVLLDFGFNGWGGKYPADLDNGVTRCLKETGAFGPTPVKSIELILEGGSIESDGRGTLLTTRSCLGSPTRNRALDLAGIERALGLHLHAERVLWLAHGYLAGDDTDGHVDMLARFAPEDTILHVRCDDPRDEHAAELAAMAGELAAFRTPAGRPYRLIPLPWPAPRFDAQGRRLPASYANFLAINGAVLVPTYGDPQDAAALAAVGRAFPDRAVVGLDCSTLILQHGALHCATMQLPRGTLTAKAPELP
jgi:agmatine deiminase